MCCDILEPAESISAGFLLSAFFERALGCMLERALDSLLNNALRLSRQKKCACSRENGEK
jgi:hypothetical protein